MLVRYWMTENPLTATEELSLLRVLDKMRFNKVRRLPVVRGDELCGIVSISDLYRFVDPIVTSKDTIPAAVADDLKPRTVAQIMVPSPLTCEPNSALEDVAWTMRANKVGALPVVRGTKLIGIITESDVLGALAQVARYGSDGHRVCFKVPEEKKREVFYQLVEFCNRYEADLLTVLTHPIPEENVRLITIRFRGDNDEELVEALWASEYQVMQVVH